MKPAKEQYAEYAPFIVGRLSSLVEHYDTHNGEPHAAKWMRDQVADIIACYEKAKESRNAS